MGASLVPVGQAGSGLDAHLQPGAGARATKAAPGDTAVGKCSGRNGSREILALYEKKLYYSSAVSGTGRFLKRS